MKYMFIVLYMPAHLAPENATVIVSILIAFSAVHLGMLAFVYPKIFETTRNLKDISAVFIKKLDQLWYVKHYLSITTIGLLLNIVALLLCIFITNSILLHLLLLCTFIPTIFVICLSYYVFKTLDQYYNKTETLFKADDNTTKLDSDNNENLQLLRSITIYSMNHNDLHIFNQYISIINNNFLSTIAYYQDKIKDMGTLFFLQQESLYIFSYIYKKAVDSNIHEASIFIFNTLLKTLNDLFPSPNKNNTQNNNNSMLGEQRINTIINSLQYKIKQLKFGVNDIPSLFLVYTILLKANINFPSIKPNTIIFPIFQNLIDFNIFIKIYIQWGKQIENIYYSPDKTFYTNTFSEIQKLNLDILSYLLFKEKYQEAEKFMYYETPKENIYKVLPFQIPLFLPDIFSYYIGEHSSFKENKIFDNIHSSRKYEYYTLFLLLCNVKYRNDTKRLEDAKKHTNKLDSISAFNNENIDADIINNISIKDLFYNDFNNKKILNKYIEDFFSNKKLIQQFDINEESCKEFIKKIIIEIHQQIIRKRTPFIKNPLPSEIENEILSYSKDIYDAFTSKDFIHNIFTINNKEEETLNFEVKTKEELGDITFSENQGTLLIHDNNPSIICQRLNSVIEKTLFQKLANKTNLLKNYKKLETHPMDTYCAIINTSSYSFFFSKIFPAEFLCYEKYSESFVKSIIINNVSIPIIASTLSNSHELEEFIILFMDKSKFRLTTTPHRNLQITEQKLDKEFVFDPEDEEYSTPYIVNITMPSFINIEYTTTDTIGFRLTAPSN